MRPRLAVFVLAVATCSASGALAAEPSPSCTPGEVRPVRSELLAQLDAANRQIAASDLSGDIGSRMALYAADAVAMPEFQPRLFGRAAIDRHYRTLAERLKVAGYTRSRTEALQVGRVIVEAGQFTLSLARSGGPTQDLEGKYLNVWRRQADGSLKIRAEAWGFHHPTDDPAVFRTDMSETAGRIEPVGAQALGAELDALNAANARAVRSKDAAAKLAIYTDASVFYPFADTPKAGLAVLRPYFERYTAQGADATFESVRIWNEGYEDLGGFVLEYPKFEVRWRSSGQAGTVSGGGLRLWRREADCSLKILRQIGTHDHRG